MGRAGRIACIFTPFALTVASFICLLLIELSGWNTSLLPQYYFLKADFTDLSTSGASSDTLTTELNAVKDKLDDIYEIHLWNYCTSNKPNGTINYCSPREREFSFNFAEVWGLAAGSSSSSSKYTSQSYSSIDDLRKEPNVASNELSQEEQDLLGKTDADALEAYQKASRIMFILYAASFWSTLLTILLSIAAIFSRWGSFFTWILSGISSLLTVGAVALTTAIFITLTASLKDALDPYNVKIDLGTSALAIGWLSVVFSWAATLFWLFSVCCCSGKNNPHHRSNKGGLWNAEPKGMGYGEYNGRRSLRVEKTGGYERVASPFLGHAENEHGDRVPLNDYPRSHGHSRSISGSYEPYRDHRS